MYLNNNKVMVSSQDGGIESGLDGSDLDSEFLSPIPGSLATFEPKRCSTPLSSAAASTCSWSEYVSGRDNTDSFGVNNTFEQRHCVPSGEMDSPDHDGYDPRQDLRCASSPLMRGNIRTSQQHQQHQYAQQYAQQMRRLPMAGSPLPGQMSFSPNILRPRPMPVKQQQFMVPEYSVPSTPSPSFFPHQMLSQQHLNMGVPQIQPVAMNLQSSALTTYAQPKETVSQTVPTMEHAGCGSSSRNSMGCCGCSSPMQQAPLQMEQYARVANFRGAHKGINSAKGNSRWSAEHLVDRQAQAYRSAANVTDPTVVWSGNLPTRYPKGSAYSCKVFLGGVPWDITESNLNAAFGKYGQLKVEWPSNYGENPGRNSKGYLYIIFENERSVRALLSNCTMDASPSSGGRNYYYKVCSTKLRRKDVQVIPWPLSDSTYVHPGCISTSGTKTVFVGSLHGMLNAEGLARIMNDLFGGVVTANIDTDKYKYPIGSGRVVFNCTQSYVKAIRAAFVEVRTQKFSKKIQIDPFLEDSVCSICAAQMGPYFCRDMECFNYFCGTCWQWQHSVDNLKRHTPMMRNPRSHDD